MCYVILHETNDRKLGRVQISGRTQSVTYFITQNETYLKHNINFIKGAKIIS